MNLLLIEDEAPAARRLTRLLADIRPDWTVLDVIDSVEAAVNWLRTYTHPDLLLMDVQLADGISFDIFRQVTVNVPVVFTTAYDEFTLRAFKVNSVDYLLKPIDEEELAAALQKFESLHTAKQAGEVHELPSTLAQLLNQLAAPKPAPKERLLVRNGAQMVTLPVSSLAYLYSDEGLTFAVDSVGKRHILDYTLDEAADFLPPSQFFRISRKAIVQVSAIGKIHAYFNSRLKLDLQPTPAFEVIVSRERVAEFKAWLDQ
ncbi:LytR/AlgR family response regulator transcription factor [Fibrella forsythiae]|uniref:Response regulator transcription factor n=1 Tax=Fibrella forsythiae TaxID=2817061 RepID=A0ABS3JQL8_9BACT|nr:LytTR family DNA-binding domain-containing protein [Fibrella forsythiae]MBO0952295.1 response regulator transcription factor [Fibrella forsythiae]